MPYKVRVPRGTYVIERSMDMSEARTSLGSVKQDLIELVKDRGLPVLVCIPEADSFIGYRIEENGSVTRAEYAREGVSSMEDLNLVELAHFAENGIRPASKFWEEFNEEIEMAAW